MPIPAPLRGRGSASNPANRFAPTYTESDAEWAGEVPASIATEVREECSRTIISRNASPDLPFDRSLNPYRGCEHGCIYCYARPSHAYWDLSPGLDFETRLIARSNAVELLEAQLSSPGYRCAPINLGANTDPYQPIERQYRLTRGCLEVLLRYRHPLTIVTKGALILRDLDLLQALAGAWATAAAASCRAWTARASPRRGGNWSCSRRRAPSAGCARGHFSLPWLHVTPSNSGTLP